MTTPLRFDVRFERGDGVLRLAAPVRATHGTLESLTLTIGSVKPPFELTLGAATFRHRRSVVRNGRLSFSFARLTARGAEAGVRFQVEDVLDERSAIVSVRDTFGVVAVRVEVVVDGQDLVLKAREARSAADAPTSPAARVASAALRAGLSFEPRHGGFRWRRPARFALADVFASRGWRVPEERVREFDLTLQPSGVTLHLGSTPPDSAAEERAEDVDTTVALMRDDLDTASRLSPLRADVIAERVDVLPEDATGSLDLLRAASLRVAIRQQDAQAAERVAREMERHEPSRALAAAALASAATLAFGEERPAADLVLRALDCDPAEPAIFAWLLESASRGLQPEILLRVAEAVQASPLPRATRGRLAADAARALAAGGLLERAEVLLESARDLAPDSLAVLDADATLAVMSDDHARASAALARFASPDLSEVARRRTRIARLLSQRGVHDLAESELRQALGVAAADGDPDVIVALAEVQLAQRAHGAATSTLQRLLAFRAAPSYALAHAVRYHLSRGTLVAARPFVAALRGRRDHEAREAVAHYERRIGEVTSEGKP